MAIQRYDWASTPRVDGILVLYADHLTAIEQAVQAEREANSNLYSAALIYCHSVERTLKHGKATQKLINLENAVRAAAIRQEGA